MKRRLYRCFAIVVCCMIFICSACPVAFAVDVGGGNMEFILETVVNLEFDSGANPDSEFYGLGGVSYGEFYADYSLVECPQVQIWIDDCCYLCSSFGMDGTILWGNFSLVDPDAVDTGEDFLLAGGDGFLLILPYEAETVTLKLYAIYEPGIAGSVSAGLYNVTHWVGEVVSSMISPDGALSGLLPALAIFVAIPAVFLGIKAIRSLSWGM